MTEKPKKSLHETLLNWAFYTVSAFWFAAFAGAGLVFGTLAMLSLLTVNLSITGSIK